MLLLSALLPGNLPHIGVVSVAMNDDESRPLIIHNIGVGAREEDKLSRFDVTGRYRFALV